MGQKLLRVCSEDHRRADAVASEDTLTEFFKRHRWKVGENFLRKLNSPVEELNRGRLETRLRRSFNMQTWHKLLFHGKNVHAATFGSFINRPRARLAILQRNIRPGRRRFHN
ncbi:hypothetical protein T08_211 [Trichinella sp. T8]|nr:hypothetical protein T08_211 [Trichinella sp. T8]